MRPNKVIEAWQAGKAAFAAWTSTESSYIAEILGHTGAEAVVIDMQHGMADMHSALSMLQAISTTPASPFVRVPGLDPKLIMKLLDYGSYGLICPLVDNAEQAEAFVAASSYPPRGGRSYGPVRGLLYGGPDYLDAADQTIVRLAMIETRAGLDNLEAICQVDGLEGIFLGPSDLSLSLGSKPRPEPAEDHIEEAIARCLAAAHKAGKKAGIFCFGVEGAERRTAQGFDFVVPHADSFHLAKAYRAALETARASQPD